MNRISSPKTFFFKKVLPFLLIAWPVLVIGLGGSYEENAQELVVSAFVAVAACGLVFWYMRRLADEVLDQGDHLLVSRRGEQGQVSLSEIMNVDSNTTVAAVPIITLRLAQPSKFGVEIVFLPVTKFALSFGGKNAVAEELIERTYQSRSTRGI
jgi:hypothetical protein